MSMQDILSVMIPGQSYTFEDICKELERNGYRVTNTDTVKDGLYKLAKKEYIILISGIYIRIDAIEDFPPTYLGTVREILSLMVPEEVYEVGMIKELRADVGYEPLPKEVIKAYMDYMVKVKLLEIVARNGYRLIEQNERSSLSSSSLQVFSSDGGSFSRPFPDHEKSIGKSVLERTPNMVFLTIFRGSYRTVEKSSKIYSVEAIKRG